MRDYAILAVVFASLPVGIISPYYGILVYAWVSYMNPHMLAWTVAYTFPVAKVAALSAVGGTLLHFAADPAPLAKRENITMILLWCMFTISTFFALYQADAWKTWQD